MSMSMKGNWEPFSLSTHNNCIKLEIDWFDTEIFRPFSEAIIISMDKFTNRSWQLCMSVKELWRTDGCMDFQRMFLWIVWYWMSFNQANIWQKNFYFSAPSQLDILNPPNWLNIGAQSHKYWSLSKDCWRECTRSDINWLIGPTENLTNYKNFYRR